MSERNGIDAMLAYCKAQWEERGFCWEEDAAKIVGDFIDECEDRPDAITINGVEYVRLALAPRDTSEHGPTPRPAPSRGTSPREGTSGESKGVRP